jgi:hypothetical protein
MRDEQSFIPQRSTLRLLSGLESNRVSTDINIGIRLFFLLTFHLPDA